MERLMRRREVEAATEMPTSSLYRPMSMGEIPPTGNGGHHLIRTLVRNMVMARAASPAQGERCQIA